VYDAGDIAKQRQQNVEPEVQAKPDLKKDAKRRQQDCEENSNEVHRSDPHADSKRRDGRPSRQLRPAPMKRARTSLVPAPRPRNLASILPFLARATSRTQRRYTTGETGDMGIEVGGILGLLVLIADIWAIVNVIGSAASTGSKLLWVLLILLLPVIGLIIWFVAGPRRTGAA
jgi:hypothetical protein